MKTSLKHRVRARPKLPSDRSQPAEARSREPHWLDDAAEPPPALPESNGKGTTRANQRKAEDGGTASDYKVGYKRPPKETQFKQGNRANPRGRPKGSKNFSTIAREKLDAKVAVREGSRQKQMSKGEIGITKLVNRFAESGDPKIFQTLMRLVETPSQDPAQTSGDQTPDDAERASNRQVLAWFLAQGSLRVTDGQGGDHEQ